MSAPNFSGIWRLDLAKSVLRIEAPRDLQFKIEHDEPHILQLSLTVRKDGGEDQGSFAFTIGGETVSAFRGMRAVVRAHWEGVVLIIETDVSTPRGELPGGELRLSDHWSLSDDGATLTMAHTDDVLAGQVSVLVRGSYADANWFDQRCGRGAPIS